MICKECNSEMVQDVRYPNYYICYHCGTQVSYGNGKVLWEIRKMRVVSDGK